MSVLLSFPQSRRLIIFHREESEKVSELKNVSGSTKLPYGTLASGTEGIKEAIQGFDDAYVVFELRQKKVEPLTLELVANPISKTNVYPLSSSMLTLKRVKRLCRHNQQRRKKNSKNSPESTQTVSMQASKRSWSTPVHFPAQSTRTFHHQDLRHHRILQRARLWVGREGTREQRAWGLR